MVPEFLGLFSDHSPLESLKIQLPSLKAAATAPLFSGAGGMAMEAPLKVTRCASGLAIRLSECR